MLLSHNPLYTIQTLFIATLFFFLQNFAFTIIGMLWFSISHQASYFHSDETKPGVLHYLSQIVECILEQLDSPLSSVLDVVFSALRSEKRKENKAAAELTIDILKNGEKLQVCPFPIF